MERTVRIRRAHATCQNPSVVGINVVDVTNPVRQPPTVRADPSAGVYVKYRYGRRGSRQDGPSSCLVRHAHLPIDRQNANGTKVFVIASNLLGRDLFEIGAAEDKQREVGVECELVKGIWNGAELTRPECRRTPHGPSIFRICRLSPTPSFSVRLPGLSPSA
jgi:hypothetical protein